MRPRHGLIEDSVLVTCAAVGLYGIDKGFSVRGMGVEKRTFTASAAVGKSGTANNTGDRIRVAV